MIRTSHLVWLALFTLPILASAAEGPEVPETALAAVPEEIRRDWADREQTLAEMTSEIERQRDALAVSREDDRDTTRTDLQGAKADSTQERDMTRSELEVSRSELEEARLVLDSAQQALHMGRQQLQLAKTSGDKAGIIEARGEVARAKGAIAKAEAEVATAERAFSAVKADGVARMETASQQVEDARTAKTDAADAGKGSPHTPAELKLAAAEAQRDHEAAVLELEQATVANEYGAELDLEPYTAAAEAAALGEVEPAEPDTL
jgi:hypothetical protein